MRGTPQQIIDKYGQLARDATLSGDRVAAENFQQHAEHYLRLLSEAQREQDARREQHEAQNQQNRQQPQNGQDGGQAGPQSGLQNNGQQGGQNGGQRPPNQGAAPAGDLDLADAPQPDVADALGVAGSSEADTGLVETPESKPAPKRRTRKPKVPKDAAPDAPAQ